MRRHTAALTLFVSDFRIKEVFCREMRASKGLIVLAVSHLRRGAGQIVQKDGKINCHKMMEWASLSSAISITCYWKRKGAEDPKSGHGNGRDYQPPQRSRE
jgi:hypothetical protein